jgi:hypothetical protein
MGAWMSRPGKPRRSSPFPLLSTRRLVPPRWQRVRAVWVVPQRRPQQPAASRIGTGGQHFESANRDTYVHAPAAGGISTIPSREAAVTLTSAAPAGKPTLGVKELYSPESSEPQRHSAQLGWAPWCRFAQTELGLSETSAHLVAFSLIPAGPWDSSPGNECMFGLALRR